MGKRSKPWPPFIVHIKTNKFFFKSKQLPSSFNERVKWVVYESDNKTITFSRLSSFEAQVNSIVFRRPTKTEVHLQGLLYGED